LQLIPDPSIDGRTFAQHYYDHKETWDKAFAFLKNTDLAHATLGRVELGGNMYATVSDYYLTKDRETTLLEAHQKYIDIQYIFEGTEVIDAAPLKDLTVTVPYDSDKDILFGTVPEYTELKTSPERLYIFFPNDTHRPCLKDENGSAWARKVVVKVPVSMKAI